MEESMCQYLLQVGLHCKASQLLPVQAHAVNGRPVIDLGARNVLQHQYLWPHILPVHLGNLQGDEG
jgi:hypothetical protein